MTAGRVFPNLALAVALTFLLSACGAGNQPITADQPPNLGDLQRQLLDYRNSGAYERGIAAVDAEAMAYLDQRAGQVKNPALILDIDETSLSNWPALHANESNQLKSAACDMSAGQKMARDEAIKPTLALYREAKAKKVTVFFITGRDENLRAATEKNLRAAGYDSWKALVMRPHGTTTRSAAEYKMPERAKIEAEGYTIIVNIGDQPSDLAGGHAERAFLLPDPFYRIP